MKKFTKQLHKLLKFETYENLLVKVMHSYMRRSPIYVAFFITSIFKKNFKFQISNFKSNPNDSMSNEKKSELTAKQKLKIFNQKHPYLSASTSILSYFAIVVAGFWLLFASNTAPVEAGWWDDSWSYRKQLTIESDEVTADLTNFPMLVSFTDTDLITKAQADGDDIVFTLENGTRLDHEIESFTSGTGALVAWVRIPELDSDNDSYIYMYYGNASVQINRMLKVFGMRIISWFSTC